ncbi:velvet factor-domain-containing protein, partial [Geranomyces variabilis]
QQPLRARMCGFGGRDRRLVDPPPIVQLIARHLPSNRVIEQSVTDPPLLILHASLYDAAAKEPTMIINTPRARNSGGYMNALTGCLVSSAYSLQNLEGRHGVYFMFGDLSVRVDGRFSLSSAVPPQHFVSNDITTVITQAHSLPFIVYPAKEFPGMLESTPLTRCFALQGIRLPVRGERRKANNNLNNARLDPADDDGDGTPDTLREGPEEGGTLRSLLEQGTGGGELAAEERPPPPLALDAANTTVAVPTGVGGGASKDSGMDADVD